MTTDHRIVVSKVMWEQRKVLGFKLRKMQDDKLQICKVQRWEIPFPQSSKKKVIMTSKLDKKISVNTHSLEEWKFTGIKEKGVLGLSQRAYLEKNSKEIWYACE